MTISHNTLGLILAAAVATGSAFNAHAVTITTAASGGNDGSVIYTGRLQNGTTPAASSWSSSTSGPTGSVIGLGGTFPNRTASVFVMAFRLPELPTGMQVDTANLTVYLEGIFGTPAFNVDAWGLGYSSSAALVTGTVTPSATTGYYNDVNGDGDPGIGTAIEFSDTADLGLAYGINSRVKVQDNLLTSISATGAANPHATTGTALAAYIQSLYDDGAVGGAAGDFVLLRLSPDTTINAASGSIRYEMFTNNDGGSTVPTLTLEFGPVPEPGSLALVGMGLLAIARRRR